MGLPVTKHPLTFRMQDLVLPEELRLELELIIAWVRHRKKVFETWGLARKAGVPRGLKVIFAGSPGTGKTMAAQCIASEIGLDLIRVDLSLAGSTTAFQSAGRLDKAFEEARVSPAALLLDGVDTFLARSQLVQGEESVLPYSVSDVVERTDAHAGMVILTVRRADAVSAAFARRIHFLVEFPTPDEESRRRIWEGMFPEECERSDDVDFGLLASQFELTGREIRDSVLAAAFLAASADTPITLEHLRRAVRHTIRVRPRRIR